MNLKKLKRLLCVALSLSMLLSTNMTAFATEMGTEAEEVDVVTLAALADRAETAVHDHFDASGNPIDGIPVWSDWEVKEPAHCETPGYEIRHCTVEFCYEIDVHELAPLGHEYNEGIVTQAATCSQEGKKTVICQRDASIHGSDPEEEEVSIPVVPHNYEGGKPVTIPPTCKTSGQTGIACKFGCGTVNPESLQDDPTNPATGHSYKAVDPNQITTAADLNALNTDKDAGITVNKATCTSAGSLILECKNEKCDGTDAEKKIEKPINASGHSYGSHISGKELDELTTGELQALTTATDDGIIVTKASCTTPGSVTCTCKNSWHEEDPVTREIPALGHDWDDGTITEEATCESAGTKTSTCQRCRTEDTVTIPAKGHSFGTIDTTNLTNEQLKELANADGSAKKGITAVPATCTSKGSLTLQCTKEDCDKGSGAHVEKEIPALGHSYDNGVILAGEEATCLTGGKKTYTCTNGDCDGGLDADSHGKTYKVDIPATGHSYGTITVDEEKKEVSAQALQGIKTDEAKGIKVESSSCTQTGKLTLTCQNENCDDNNDPKEYTILSSEHSWTEKTYREMDCKTKKTGMVQKTCTACGTTEWEVIQVAHTYEADGWFDTATEDEDFTVTEERTCTTDGKVIPTCSVCEKVGEEMAYPKTGHSYEAEGYNWPEADYATAENLEAAGVNEPASQASTCTSAGYQYFVCTNDNCDNSDEPVKAVYKHTLAKAEHDFAGEATTKEATCTKPAITAKFCQNPGCTEYEPGSATIGEGAKGHSYAQKRVPTLGEVKEAGIEGITSEADLSKKGDCVTDGYNYYICDNANCDKGEGYIHKEVSKAIGEHDMQPQEETIPATCTHPEQMHSTCSICGYDEIIDASTLPPDVAAELDPALEHAYTVLLEEIVPANCKEGEEQPGVAKYGCANGACGTTQLKTTKPEHEWVKVTDGSEVQLGADEYEDGDRTPYQAPTCNAAGYQYSKCLGCGKVKKETVDKLEHNYTEKATDDDATIIGEAIKKESTCAEQGYEYYRCTQPGCKDTDDGHYKKELLPLDPSKHNFQENTTIPATCTEPEKRGTLCTVCGEAQEGTDITKTGEPLGHVNERDSFDEESGYDSLTKSTLEDLAAEGIEEPVSQASTCTQAGYEYYNCNFCKQGTEGHAIKVEIEKKDHAYEFTEVASTCTEYGKLTVECKECGDRTETDITSDPPTGHEFIECKQEDATCESTGKTAGWECKKCHEPDLEDPQAHPAREEISVDPNNHVWEKVGDDSRNVDPDCTSGKTGVQVYRCTVHTDKERIATVPAVHQWEDPIMQNCVNMTYMPGLLYHTCGICGESEILRFLTDCKICEADEHKATLETLQEKDENYKFTVVKPTTLPAQAATCTQKGKTEGKVCSCGAVLTAQEDTEMIAHEGELVVKEAGDCGHDGIKQHRCAACNQYYGETETFKPETSGKHTLKATVIPATCAKPMQVQNTCTVCGYKEEPQDVAGTQLPHKFGADGRCTECGIPGIVVTTKAEASDADGTNTLILSNSFAVNDTDTYEEVLEVGINYIVSKSRIEMGREQLMEDLEFATRYSNMKNACTDDIDTNLRKITVSIDVTGRTTNPVAARAYVKVKVNGEEEYRYGDLVVRTFESESYFTDFTE